MRATVADYETLLTGEPPQGLRPPGPALAGDPALLAAFAPSYARAHNRALDLLDEADPTTTQQMLADQEREWGLPDDCAQSVASTLQGRRAALVEKRTSRGGATLAYLKAVALRLGYDVDIVEHRPFICGLGRCGDALNGGHAIRRYILVTVRGPRITLFRAGASQCGDALGSIAAATDLMCRLKKVAHAHLDIRFAYEGV